MLSVPEIEKKHPLYKVFGAVVLAEILLCEVYNAVMKVINHIHSGIDIGVMGTDNEAHIPLFLAFKKQVDYFSPCAFIKAAGWFVCQ